MRSRNMIITAVLALGVIGIGAATLLPSQTIQSAVQTTASLQTATFAVENMTCATCPITVRRAMQGVEGVHAVAVDYEAKTATAQFDPARTTSGAIAAASANAGYPAQVAGS